MRSKALNSRKNETAFRILVRLAGVLALWMAIGTLHAAPIFKCVDAQGHIAFRDTPCAERARQTRIELHPQPTIGDADEVAAARARARSPASRHQGTATRSRKQSAQRRHAKPVMSWECRAADGEVFYRHKRCPGSVPGDGVVRTDYMATTASNQTTRRRQNAWSGVRVSGHKIPRAEACRRMHSAGAAGRDGHLRDATVSTYDHLMGRDPCDAN